MASGIAVASTDVGDVRVMLPPEAAPHIAARDPAALAEALRPLVGQAALRDSLGRRNRAKAERDYDQETMFGAYAALIDGEGPAGRH
jgi:glycosyltransferase involved in cell wall biosynthesis